MASATRIPIAIPGAPTSLLVERGAIARLDARIAEVGAALRERSVLLVVDRNVAALADRAAAALGSAGARVARVDLVATEPDKSLAQVERVWQAALAARVDRQGLVVALGGGLVGDLAGFAAATYLRGIPLVQVPTTLLAMVDASIGGKTGINLPLPEGGLGKNLAGAFHQPILTIADPDALATLPARELRAGLAECLKHALIAGEPLFGAFERDASKLAAGDAAALDELIPASASVKGAIVARDPFERGERAKLNLCHTFGHAIETIPGLDLLHGEAVAIGCAAAAAASTAAGTLDPAVAKRIEAAIAAAGLPTRLPTPVAIGEVRRRMGFDKKNEGGRLRLILPRSIGDVAIVPDPAPAAVDAGLRAIGCT
ncbi:MAG: 3-dehydroquinate synthase [Planctomycetota bacterium]